MCMARPKAGKPGQPGLRCLSQARPWGAALQAHRPGLRISKPGPGLQATALSACGSQDLPTFCPLFPLISTPAHFFFPLAFPLPFPPFSGGGLLAHQIVFQGCPDNHSLCFTTQLILNNTPFGRTPVSPIAANTDDGSPLWHDHHAPLFLVYSPSQHPIVTGTFG